MPKLLTRPVKKSKKTSKSKAVKRVYFFGNGKAEGGAHMKDLLGGKGANLADMTTVPLPVPPGFTITTDTCGDYNDLGQKLPRGLMEEVKSHLARVEKATGKKFGDPGNPLLVAVRSGGKVSMPGMMDTVLNIGMNDDVVEGMVRLTNNERFAFDSYRRLINMFGDTVMGVDHHHFEQELTAVKNARGAKVDTDLDAEGLKEVVERYKKVYRQIVGDDFPQDPLVQLEHAIEAVFKSWMGDRAIKYRELNDIRGLRGRLSMCSRWCSGTWETIARRAWRSREIRPRVRIGFTANFWSMPRARTWSPASARRWIARANWASGRRKAGRSC